MTAKEAILNVLQESDRPLAVFEFGLMGVSQTSISARLRELRRENKVFSVPVKGAKYTKWLITPQSDYAWAQDVETDIVHDEAKGAHGAR